MDIKKRAKRNGKVRATINEINKTVAKLGRMKEEYKQKAIQAKQRGDEASYRLAKHGLNATMSQLKRAQEMLLNIEITAELQRMGETNADFLTGMSTIAKRISKINKQSDFVKLQKEIDKALCGMEEAQAGLDGFLTNSEAAFAAISSSAESLTDEQMDRFIDGDLSEKQLLMDDEIERLAAAAGATSSAPRREIPVGGDTSSDPPPAPPRDDLVAPLFPMPSGTFNFSPTPSTPVPKDMLIACGLIKTEEPVYFAAGEQIPFATSPNISVCADAATRKAFILRTVTELIGSFTAREVKVVLADLDGIGLNVFNGAAHCAANAVTERAGVIPTIDALMGEVDRRYGLFAQFGVSNIAEYNNSAVQKLPFIVAVFDGCQNVNDPQFDRAFSSLARQSRDCGIFTVAGLSGVPAPAVRANTAEVGLSGVAAFDVAVAARIVAIVGGAL